MSTLTQADHAIADCEILRSIAKWAKDKGYPTRAQALLDIAGRYEAMALEVTSGPAPVAKVDQDNWKEG